MSYFILRKLSAFCANSFRYSDQYSEISKRAEVSYNSVSQRFLLKLFVLINDKIQT